MHSYKEYTTEMGKHLKNLKIVLYVAPIGDDEVIPVREMGKCTIEGVKVNSDTSYVNFKTEV